MEKRNAIIVTIIAVIITIIMEVVTGFIIDYTLLMRIVTTFAYFCFFLFLVVDMYYFFIGNVTYNGFNEVAFIIITFLLSYACDYYYSNYALVNHITNILCALVIVFLVYLCIRYPSSD